MTLASILIQRRPRAASASRSRRSASACSSARRSCARTSTCSTSSTSAAAPTCSTRRSTRRTGEIEVDPEPYSDNFDRPARLLPVEAKALVAAIDLIGEHIPEGSLTSAREKIVAALGEDPMEQGLQVAHAAGDDSDVARQISKAIVEHRLIELEYYKENEDEISHAQGRALRADQRPRGLVRGVASTPSATACATSAWTASSSATVTDETFEPRPEVDPAAEVDGWLRTGEVRGVAHARACGSRPSARAGRARRGAWSRSAATARSSSS